VLNLSVFLEASAGSHPDRDAVVLGDLRLTYAQVNGFANQVANLLVSRGIRPGDKYVAGLTEIRMIQDYIVERARRNDVPVIENESVSEAIGAVLELVLDRAERHARVAS